MGRCALHTTTRWVSRALQVIFLVHPISSCIVSGNESIVLIAGTVGGGEFRQEPQTGKGVLRAGTQAGTSRVFLSSPPLDSSSSSFFSFSHYANTASPASLQSFFGNRVLRLVSFFTYSIYFAQLNFQFTR